MGMTIAAAAMAAITTPREPAALFVLEIARSSSSEFRHPAFRLRHSPSEFAQESSFATG
ncbi:hypothetical protein [Streptomyces sp. RTGN2]|uniref:hypothetical protein n=1 Tax=Streptomyces sp. RTGN2 TaxID=3016525 RepID=UPI0025534F52|nr:hypothetical protein [Streptomyces sp. RTGN2]